MAVSIDIQVDGVSDLIQNLKSYELRKRGAVMGVLETTALSIDRTVKRSLSQPGTGRTYTRRGGGKASVTHQASAPGKPPATDMGRLKSAVHVRRPGPMTRDVTAETDYALPLEFGTRNMAARPFMTPAWQAHKNDFIRDIKQVFSR